MDAYQLKKILKKLDCFEFKSKNGVLFKVFISADSYNITRKLGNVWRFHSHQEKIDSKKLYDTIALEIINLIKTE